jgi:hypothetical protein
MLMADHEMKTTAPDTGLRIKTEVKAQQPGAAAARGEPDIVCRNVNLSYGDNHVLHDITMDIEELGSPPSSDPRAAASRRCSAA